MKYFRHAKLTAVVCIFSILFITGVSTAENQDKVTTPDSEVFISTAQFSLPSLYFLQLALFIIFIRAVLGPAGW